MTEQEQQTDGKPAPAPDSDDDGSMPEIDEDAMADFDANTAAKVEAEYGAEGGEYSAGGDMMGDMDGDVPDFGDGESLGDFYCKGLSLLAHVISTNYGDGDSAFYDDGAPEGEKIDTTLAKELKLDVHVDRMMAARDMNDLPPGKALVVGTFMFAMAVVVTQPELLAKLSESANL